MNSRVIIGSVLILLGGLFLLDLNGLIDFSLSNFVHDWWPLLIIFWGVNSLRDKNSSLTWGLIILCVGLLLQASQLDMLPFSFWSAFWPLLLIIVGIAVIFGKRNSHSFEFEFDGKNVNKDQLNIATIFSGTKERIISDDFKGGKITTIFGGTEVDLRDAKINSNAQIEIEAIFGGVSIMVPRNVRVVVTGTPIFGGLENNTHYNITDPDNEIILGVNYLAAFGGIEIKD